MSEIEAFYVSHQALYDYLLAQGQITFANDANDNFRRSLVLAIASYFEQQVSEIIREIPRRYANGHAFVCELIEQKAVLRQYHSYFQWDGRNANSFFRMFGPGFLDKAKADVKSSNTLDNAIKAFLELGETRNKLVHINYVTYDFDKTPSDIIDLYRTALPFFAYLRRELLDNSV